MIDFEESVAGQSQHRVSATRVEIADISNGPKGSQSMRRDDRNNPKLGRSIDMADEQALPEVAGQASSEHHPLHTEDDNYDWSAKSGKSVKIQDLSKEMFDQE